MAWDWIYRMLGMPVRPGEGPARREPPVRAEPRRLRPLAEPGPGDHRSLAEIMGRVVPPPERKPRPSPSEVDAQHRAMIRAVYGLNLPERSRPADQADRGQVEARAERVAQLRARHRAPAVDRTNPESASGQRRVTEPEQRLASDAERRDFDRRIAEAARGRPSPPGWPRGEYGAPDRHHVKFVPRFLIDYEDYQGSRTRRWVTIHSFTAEEQPGEGVVGYVEAFCDLRRDVRTFRLDRILAVIDDDGVVHDDAVGYLSEALGIDLHAELE